MKRFRAGTTKRAAGILLPVFSLPSPHGIGTFGRAAYEWVDFLKDAGQLHWQILPLGPTGYGDSPYQSFSAFAGNSFFIDLDMLAGDGLLKPEEIDAIDWGESERQIDYDAVAAGRNILLRKAYSRFDNPMALRRFREEHMGWIDDYTLYMATKAKMGGTPWYEWDVEIRMHEPQAIARLWADLQEDIEYHLFVQHQFYKQWISLKAYANRAGIGIIGDIPIYVSMDSADTWANSELFLLDENGRPTDVAGCPPDYFSEDGQLWGNPLYRWDVLREQEYGWWMDRMEFSLTQCDLVRIDHFRGFESYYAIPGGAATAKNGEWRRGPGMDLIGRINEAFGGDRIIAEDLGILTDDVRWLLKNSGYPGMKILQFAFSPNAESDYLPHHHHKHCVIYSGTHDNDTTMGWLTDGDPAEVARAMDYLATADKNATLDAIIRAALASVANLAILPMQDYLRLDNRARVNTPSTLGGGNWCYRMGKWDAAPELAQEIFGLTSLYGRL
ncbi:MAG: 4-alpha-glucanotransferase [Oscillospiraceae bacterium]|nr:4-alpha-glucanotransferase [Oscillospiraceae bacterium]